MPDAQTTYELRLACDQPGCPVCTLVRRAGARYVESIFNESMLDPDVRRKLAESLGFCYDHTWRSIDLKLSDALGHAILYQDLVENVLQTITGNERNPGGQLADALDPGVACPACRIEQAAQERALSSLAAGLRETDFVSDFRHSSGLCLPHLRQLLPSLDQKRQMLVLDHQRQELESLKGELAEFIRKNDYRFRDEVIGKEGDSYRRAAEMLKGKQPPANTKDLFP